MELHIAYLATQRAYCTVVWGGLSNNSHYTITAIYLAFHKPLLLLLLDIGTDRLCGLVVRVLGYRSGGPDSIPATTGKKK
jgi:hypothetical protein